MNIDIASMILSRDDTVYEVVPCPEWGVDVTIRSLSATERDKWEEGLMKTVRKMRKGKIKTTREPSYDNIRAKLVAVSACVGLNNSTRIFTDEQANALGMKNAAVLDRLFDVAQRLSAFTEEDVEELTKN